MGSKQAEKRGLRYCSDCGFKLRKDGFAQNGKQRWECLHCRTSKHIRRPDLSQRYTLTRFVDYLVSTDSADKRFDSAAAFRRQSNWCWNVEPRPFITGEIYDYLVIDAKPLKGGTCAIVRSRDYVRTWQHGVSENSVLWQEALSILPEPGAVVCDGQRGIYKALDQLWPGVVIQRCHIHIKRNIRTKLTQNPKTDAGADLR